MIFRPRPRDRDREQQRTVEGVTVNLVLAAIGLLLATALLFWATGQLSGRLFGGAWPDVGLDDMGGVMMAVFANLGDPAVAWPEGTRELVPGRIPFYGTMTVLLVAALAVAVAVSTFVRDPLGLRRRRRRD